jgi:NAD(P)-dependent dehydrogenase (short-subunit alcohol dehydrogenase family)
MRLENKVVLITGSARGIGKGIARRLAREGATIVVVDRDQTAGEAVADELRSELDADAAFIRANLGYEDQASDAVVQAGERHGQIDVLINSAQGYNGVGPLLEKTTGEFDYSLRTGFYASFWTMRAAVPYMQRTGSGSIINFTSLDGINGEPNFADYDVAKEAIRGLSKVAARELGPLNIRVNCICPVADTPVMANSERQWPGFSDNILRSIPMARLGDAEDDIGGVALFLASEDSRYVTGMTMHADGGTFLCPPRSLVEPATQSARPERRLVWQPAPHQSIASS